MTFTIFWKLWIVGTKGLKPKLWKMICRLTYYCRLYEVITDFSKFMSLYKIILLLLIVADLTWLLRHRFAFTFNPSPPSYISHMEPRCAHCYCASLVRTLYMTWCLPRHVFQACAPSRNSTKNRADELCDNLISEYFCWMLGDPHFFSANHFLFWFLPIY